MRLISPSRTFAGRAAARATIRTVAICIVFLFLIGRITLAATFGTVVPGMAGVYQINVQAPFKGVPTGMQLPLTIAQGGYSTTVKVRVVD